MPAAERQEVIARRRPAPVNSTAWMEAARRRAAAVEMLAHLIDVARTDGTLRGVMAAEMVLNRVKGRAPEQQREPGPARPFVVFEVAQEENSRSSAGHTGGPPLE
jgi:hypothetical protein